MLNPPRREKVTPLYTVVSILIRNPSKYVSRSTVWVLLSYYSLGTARVAAS
jgi:hypothetical protein